MNQDQENRIAKLESDLTSLSQQFFKNNFSTHQDFNKDCAFNTKLTPPIFSTLPSCTPGDVCVYSNSGTYKLMVCTATDTWTISGTQS